MPKMLVTYQQVLATRVTRIQIHGTVVVFPLFSCLILTCCYYIFRLPSTVTCHSRRHRRLVRCIQSHPFFLTNTPAGMSESHRRQS